MWIKYTKENWHIHVKFFLYSIVGEHSFVGNDIRIEFCEEKSVNRVKVLVTQQLNKSTDF